jgi:flagellar biosynthetic protein FliP
MLSQVREKDLRLFIDMAREPEPATPQEVGFSVLIPAFMESPLRFRAPF